MQVFDRLRCTPPQEPEYTYTHTIFRPPRIPSVNDKTSLLDVVLVCRRFHDLALPLLYEHLELPLATGFDAEGCLHQTLLNQPKARTWVKYVTLNEVPHNFDSRRDPLDLNPGPERKQVEEIFVLLKHIHGLRSTSTILRGRLLDYICQLDGLDVLSLEHSPAIWPRINPPATITPLAVKHLELSGGSRSNYPRSFSNLIMNCHLRSLTLNGFAMVGFGELIPMDGIFPELRHLYVDFGIDGNSLLRLLKLSPNLQHFTHIQDLDDVAAMASLISADVIPRLEEYHGSSEFALNLIPGRPIRSLKMVFIDRLHYDDDSHIQRLTQGAVPLTCLWWTSWCPGIMRRLANAFPELRELRFKLDRNLGVSAFCLSRLLIF